MKRMSEVFKGEVKVTGRYLTSDSAHAAFSDTPTAQHAAHAINHVDALADALEFLLNEYVALANSGDAGKWSAEETPEGVKAIAALAAYRGDN